MGKLLLTRAQSSLSHPHSTSSRNGSERDPMYASGHNAQCPLADTVCYACHIPSNDFKGKGKYLCGRERKDRDLETIIHLGYAKGNEHERREWATVGVE